VSVDADVAPPGWSRGMGEVADATAPLVVLLAYVGLAALVYVLRNRSMPAFHDEEMDTRGTGGLTSAPLRHFFAWLMRPVWQGLARIHFPPDVITKLSLAIALGAAVAVAGARFALGGWLFLAAGVLDFLDGRVARVTRAASRRGAALDSILDRYVEASLLGALCWYYRHDWVLAAGLVALTGSLLVPYVRARGEALGVKVDDVGFMQRPERVVLLGLGTALSPVIEACFSPHETRPRYHLAILALLVVGVTSHVSAAQRLMRVLRVAGEPPTGYQPLKSVLANAAATSVDFAVATALFYGARQHGSVAVAVGSIAGAFVSFGLSRVWAFRATAGSVARQIDRYVFASAVTAGLNAGGVALLALLSTPFVLAWALARAVVFGCWSYPVQRDFVFATTPPKRDRPGSAPGPGLTPDGPARATASGPH
jgi:phosphatidylglycerophosphate synthase/putative flippase GtrA